MKTRLLKLALCAFVAALPIGAWADEPFGGQKYISSTTTWTFNDLAGEVEKPAYTAVTTFDGADYYLRASSSNTATAEIKATSTPAVLTFSDGTTVTANYFVQFNYKFGTAPDTQYAGTSHSTKGVTSFAFNASVPGTCYVIAKAASAGQKYRFYFYDGTAVSNTGDYQLSSDGGFDEIVFSSNSAGTYFIGNMGANYDIYAVRFVPTSEEPKVTAKTTWTFEGLETKNYTANKKTGDGYIHASSRKADKNMAVVEESGNISFTDGTEVNYTKVLSAPGAIYNRSSDYAYTTAAFESSDNYHFAPSFGFNTAVPGTCYALMSTKSGKKIRVHFSDGSTVSVNSPEVTSGSDNEIKEVALTSTKAGTFFVGGVEAAYKIYAVRFVPSAVTATVGTSGYATFSSTSALDFTDVTEIEAYKASSTDESNVILEKVTGKIPKNTGLILKAITSGSQIEKQIPTIADGEGTDVGTNLLVPVASNMTLNAASEGAYYVLAKNKTSGEVRFAKVDTKSASLKAGQSYLALPASMAPNALDLGFDFVEGSTTGITQINNVKAVTDGAYYNLVGQRVVRPAKGGIYIVNGKKVIAE